MKSHSKSWVYLITLLCMTVAGVLPHQWLGHYLLVSAALLGIAFENHRTYLFTPTLLIGAAWIVTWALKWSSPALLHQWWIGLVLLAPGTLALFFSYQRHRHEVKRTQAGGTV